MPTTRLTNLIYRVRISIPWRIPQLQNNPPLSVRGTPLHSPQSYIRLLRRHHVLGSAALLSDGSHRTVILSSSDRPSHIVTEESYFRVASITKMATALAALTAVENGMLSLDAPVSTYLKPLSSCDGVNQITLFHLLTHTSGLSDPVNMEKALLQEVPVYSLLPGAVISAPGSCFRYSNLGFGLIGCLLESVYQLSVEDIFQKLVFGPLEMNATLSASSLSREKIVPITRIYPWRKDADLYVTPLGMKPMTGPDPSLHYGYTAGAMYVDLPSLEKMVHCLMRNGEPLIRSDLGSMMKQRHAVYGPVSPSLSYGLGLLLIDDPGISTSRILGHQGFAYGCADGAFWEEDTGRVVLFLNGGASEARHGRLGLCNEQILRWALRKEMPKWPG